MKSFLRNLVLTTLLAIAVLWVAYESAKRGVFRGTRSGQNLEAPVTDVATEPVDPTPTPLPMHFPAVDDETTAADSKHGYVGLGEAFKACWPSLTSENPVEDSEIFLHILLNDVEKLFGKIKKREVLEKTDTSQRLGLLFGNTVFSGGAAGSVVETEGVLTDLQVRAAGRMLHCENAARCECLSSIAP